MKRIRIYQWLLVFALIVTGAEVLRADNDDSEAFGVRLSGEVDYRIMTGMHVYASEEVRFLGGSSLFDRSYTQVGFSYRFCEYFKTAVSYTAIAVQKMELDESYLEWRHRVSGDLIASFRAGQWNFSLRERFQGTYRMCEVNNYQQPQMSWVLRSRLKASYEFRTVPLEPYAYVEPRLMLNGVKWTPESLGDNYEDARFEGYKDVYFNRYRAAAGLEWRLNSRNVIDFYCLYDKLYDKNIDARKEGSNKGIQLKLPITSTYSDRLSVGVAYKYSF